MERALPTESVISHEKANSLFVPKRGKNWNELMIWSIVNKSVVLSGHWACQDALPLYALRLYRTRHINQSLLNIKSI